MQISAKKDIDEKLYVICYGYAENKNADRKITNRFFTIQYFRQ